MNGFNWGLPAQASTYAPHIDWGIGLIHWVMCLMFVLWGSFTVFCLVRYRARAGIRAQYEEPGHFWAIAPDLAVVAFELALIFIYAIPRWNEMRRQPPAESASTVVHVVAEQFAWNVQYAGPDGKFGRTLPSLVDMNNPIGLDRSDPAAADDFVTQNEVHVPLGKPVLVYLTSKDVIHSFFIPEFRMKTDVVPGLRVPLWFEPTKTGQFEIGCAQLCGIAHYAMRGDFFVMEPKAWDAWMKAGGKS